MTILLHEPSLEYCIAARLIENYFMGHPTGGLRTIRKALDAIEDEDEVELLLETLKQWQSQQSDKQN